MPRPSKQRSPQPAPVAAALVRWFRSDARDLPWRRTPDPYAVWVSEIMLQQTQVKTVVPFWERWMKEIPDITSVATAPEARLLKLWEGLGYYTRVRNLQKAARKIVEAHQGRFPSDPALILELPGIGRYTAGAIASIAFGQAEPILDGNVIRVLARLHGIRDNAREKPTTHLLWHHATALVTAAEKLPSAPRQGQRLSAGPCSDLNQSLMELGATICLPANPACPRCPVRRHCAAHAQNLTTQIPDLGQRAAATKRRFIAFIVERGGEILVRQRPAKVVNAGLWEFPNVEILPDQTPVSPLAGFSFNAAEKPFLTLRHSITRYRITLDVFHAEAATKPPGEWIPKAELHSLPFASAHSKIRGRIEQPSY